MAHQVMLLMVEYSEIIEALSRVVFFIIYMFFSLLRQRSKLLFKGFIMPERERERGSNNIWIESDSSFIISLVRIKSYNAPQHLRVRWCLCLLCLSKINHCISHVYREGIRKEELKMEKEISRILIEQSEPTMGMQGQKQRNLLNSIYQVV